MSNEKFLFTSESVTEGHPDKVADAISDSILDTIMAQDKSCRVACETLVTTGLAFIAGWLAALAQAIWQVSTLDIDAPRNCLTRFISNKYLGFLLWLGILG